MIAVNHAEATIPESAKPHRICVSRADPLAARGESLASHRDGRGAPRAWRDDREYREYLREEQRSPRGCIARRTGSPTRQPRWGPRMQPDFHHGLLYITGGDGGYKPLADVLSNNSKSTLFPRIECSPRRQRRCHRTCRLFVGSQQPARRINLGVPAWTASGFRARKSDVVQAFRPARRGGPEGPHYILQSAPEAFIRRRSYSQLWLTKTWRKRYKPSGIR